MGTTSLTRGLLSVRAASLVIICLTPGGRGRVARAPEPDLVPNGALATAAFDEVFDGRFRFLSTISFCM